MDEKEVLEEQGEVPSEKLSMKWVWIILSVVLLLAIIISVFLIYDFGEEDIGRDDLSERIESCVDEYDEDCNSLWEDASVMRKCVDTAVADKCFYRVASYQQDSSPCLEINNQTLKESCIIENENPIF